MRVGIVGCGGHRTGGWGHPPLRRVTIGFVGAAVPSGPSITGVPPWSPSSVMAAPCHLLPCGAKARPVLTGMLGYRNPSPHPSWLRRATFPQGKAIKAPPRRRSFLLSITFSPAGRRLCRFVGNAQTSVAFPSSGPAGHLPPGEGHLPCHCAPFGSLVKGSWHGEAVTEGFRSPALFKTPYSR